MLVNSKEYWDYRFDNNWIERNGINQTEAFMKLLIKHLNVDTRNKLSSTTILDWGCGIGIGVKVLSDSLSAKVTGMDISESAIKRSKELYPEHEFISADIVKTKKKYDVIITSNVLEHFSDPHKYIVELMKRANKYVVILVPWKETHVGGDSAEHQYAFDDKDFPEESNGFRLTQKTIINNCDGCWLWEQVLVVYEKI